MRVPPRITATWIDSLSDENLLLAELRLKNAFAKEERAEKRRLGRAYDLMRGPAELMLAWDRWSRVNAATRTRKLNPTRVPHYHPAVRPRRRPARPPAGGGGGWVGPAGARAPQAPARRRRVSPLPADQVREKCRRRDAGRSRDARRDESSCE